MNTCLYICILYDYFCNKDPWQSDDSFRSHIYIWNFDRWFKIFSKIYLLIYTLRVHDYSWSPFAVSPLLPSPQPSLISSLIYFPIRWTNKKDLIVGDFILTFFYYRKCTQYLSFWPCMCLKHLLVALNIFTICYCHHYLYSKIFLYLQQKLCTH